jgi:glucan phosphoethanolaminetransferase (alkaline phosphatase superfamily)
MSDKTLKHLVASVIVLLLVFQIGSLISSLFGMIWGVLSGIAVVAAVMFFSAHLAKTGREKSFWFILPILLFTVVAMILIGWNVMAEEVSGFERLARLMPFIVGFGAPVVLLLVVYHELRKRTSDDDRTTPP